MRKTELARAHRHWFDTIKLARGCMDCGYNEVACGLHWHHRDPVPRRYIVSSIYGMSWIVIAMETAKCDVVCAPCHWERHRVLNAAKRRG